MPQALEAATYVRQGVWTDWNKGAAKGLTVTLSQQYSNVLVAALALFITVVGSQFWTMLRFAVHQSRATTRPKPGHHHQQQVLIRNSGSSIGFLASLSFIAARWRRRPGHPLRSSLLLALPAIAHLALVTVLGLVSAPLIKVGDQVLTRSPYCKTNALPREYFDLSNLNLFMARRRLSNSDQKASMEFARTCYNTTSPPKSLCGPYSVPSVKYDIKRNIPCPFDDSVCHPDIAAITIDTGLLDSMTILGLNSKPQDRFFFRKVATCIPLNDAKYVRLNDARSPNGLNASSAYYGPKIGSFRRNSTYVATNFYGELFGSQMNNLRPYEISYNNAWQPAKGDTAFDVKTFEPITELVRVNSDLHLVSMIYPGYYQAPIDDPWFSAHIQVDRNAQSVNRTVPVKLYMKDTPISTLACTHQYQVCVSNTSHCTGLKGLRPTEDEVNEMGGTLSQEASLGWLFTSLYSSDLNSILLMGAGTTPLLANDLVYASGSPSLPINQWELEVEHWWSICFAIFQRTMLHLATGQFVVDTSFINTTRTPAQQQLCDNVMIRGTGFQSFSLLFLIIILVVGLMIIIASLFLESCIASIQTRYRRGIDRRDMWQANELLQLQRLMYEAHGIYAWKGRGDSIPITKSYEPLPAYKIHDYVSLSDPSPDSDTNSCSATVHGHASKDKMYMNVEVSPVSTPDSNLQNQLFTSSQPSLELHTVKRKPLHSSAHIVLSPDQSVDGHN